MSSAGRYMQKKQEDETELTEWIIYWQQFYFKKDIANS